MKMHQHPYTEEIITFQRIYGSEKGEMYFAFDCDEQGTVDLDKLHEAAVANYKACESGTKIVNDIKMVFIEIKRWAGEVKHDRIGICDDCEAKVWLVDPLTNECDCGALYNMSGQRLKPRSEWEERMDEED